MNNTAKNGGCIFLEKSPYAEIKHCHFKENNASNEGGAIAITKESNVFICNSHFEGNVAHHNGAVLHILESNSVTVSNCTFKSNKALDSGGAIRVSDKSNISLSDSYFEGNEAEDNSGALYIRNDSNATISSCTFIRNKAQTVGGSIQLLRNSKLTIKDSKFEKNKANDGGALFVQNSSKAKICNTSFYDNAALGGGDNEAEGSGGAISIQESGALWVYRSIFNNNKADLAGAISIRSSSKATVFKCKFTNNAAMGSAGTILLRKNSTLELKKSNFTGNTAGSVGGALSVVNNCSLSVNSSQFMSNNATYGGCVQISDASSVNVSNSEFEYCAAAVGGGAISISAQSNLSLFLSSFTNNTAKNGAGIEIDEGSLDIDRSSFSFGLAVLSGGAINASASKLSIRDSTFKLNNAKAGNGGAIDIKKDGELTGTSIILQSNTAGSLGGGISAKNNVNIDLQHGEFLDNKAQNGSGLDARDQVQIQFHAFKFQGNTARTSGAAVYVQSSKKLLSFNNCTFSKNSANYGAAVYANDVTINIINCSLFEYNTAREGGALHIIQTNLTLIQTIIRSNTAHDSGGGIFALNGSIVNASNLTVALNSANHTGGGIAMLSRTSLVCKSCFFKNNTASQGAGLHIMSDDSDLIVTQLDDCVFQSNIASYCGGGIDFHGPENKATSCKNSKDTCGHLVMRNTSFLGNYAELSGAALISTDLEIVRVTCASPSTHDNITKTTLYSLQTIDPHNLCANWSENHANNKEIGKEVTSYGRKFTLRFDYKEDDYANDITLVPVKEGEYRIQNLRKGAKIPDLFIEAFEVDGNIIAPTSQQMFNLVVRSEEGVVKEQHNINMTNGIGVIKGKQFDLFLDPNDYNVTLTSENPAFRNIKIVVHIRSCQAGEIMTEHGGICEDCKDLAYNFNATPGAKCQPCPNNANCKGRFITPEDDYSNQSPCSDDVKACLIREACQYPNRTSALFNITMNSTQCPVSELVRDQYDKALCNEGYKGPLCGSCKKRYGLHFGFRCVKCAGKGWSFLSIFGIICYLLVFSSITITGNLPSTVQDTSNKSESKHMKDQESSLTVVIESKRAKVKQDTHAPPDASHKGKPVPVGNAKSSEIKECELARWKATESLKILMNFLQVTAIAASVTARWTEGAMTMFMSFDVIGALTTAALTAPIDCIVASSSGITRSLWRISVVVSVPISVMILYAIFWGIRTYLKSRGFSYFMKRVLLSIIAITYISYLALTKTAVKLFYCVDISNAAHPPGRFSHRHLAFDTSIKCFHGGHFALITIGSIILLVVTVSFPVTLAVVLYRHKSSKQTESWIPETMGFLYRAYEKNFKFWECLLMNNQQLPQSIRAVLASVVITLNVSFFICLLTNLIYSCLPVIKQFLESKRVKDVSLASAKKKLEAFISARYPNWRIRRKTMGA
eukprot:g2327.t1